MTYINRFNTCRFCDSFSQNLVKYGTRHYAHFDCYLDAGKKLDELHGWQVSMFPYRLLQERGLLDDARRLAGGENPISGELLTKGA
jgi:hypothetical protein